MNASESNYRGPGEDRRTAFQASRLPPIKRTVAFRPHRAVSLALCTQSSGIMAKKSSQ